MDIQKKTMSVMEMAGILGPKKTDAYWMVHKQCFETTLVQGIMRINIESFEHWYANQIKHKKVNGPPPGEELKSYSYSIAECLSDAEEEYDQNHNGIWDEDEDLDGNGIPDSSEENEKHTPRPG